MSNLIQTKIIHSPFIVLVLTIRSCLLLKIYVYKNHIEVITDTKVKLYHRYSVIMFPTRWETRLYLLLFLRKLCGRIYNSMVFRLVPYKVTNLPYGKKKVSTIQIFWFNFLKWYCYRKNELFLQLYFVRTISYVVRNYIIESKTEQKPTSKVCK